MLISYFPYLSVRIQLKAEGKCSNLRRIDFNIDYFYEIIRIARKAGSRSSFKRDKRIAKTNSKQTATSVTIRRVRNQKVITGIY